MDAKMSDGEKKLRFLPGKGVALSASEASEIISELDRLREFAEAMIRLYGCYPHEGNLSDCIGDELEKIGAFDDARATGGEGT